MRHNKLRKKFGPMALSITIIFALIVSFSCGSGIGDDGETPNLEDPRQPSDPDFQEAQSRIWVDLIRLEKESVSFLLTWFSEEIEAMNAEIMLSQLDGTLLVSEKIELTPNKEMEVHFDSLTPGESFQFGIRNDQDEVNWLAVIRTFMPFESGLQLFYWIDITKPETHLVGVKIYAYYKDLPSLFFDNGADHVGGHPVSPQNLSFTSSIPEIMIELSDDQSLIDFNITQAHEGYFCISYLSDKSVNIHEESGQVLGYFGPDYLIVSQTQLIYGPARMWQTDFFQNMNPDYFNAYLFINALDGWESTTGWAEISNQYYSYPDNYRELFWQFFSMGHIYAYRDDAFMKEVIGYDDYIFEIILSQALDPNYFEDIRKVYEELINIWGLMLEIPKYTVMITCPPDNNQDFFVWAGEWTTGQANTSNTIILGMIHQMYHLWNAWAVGLAWDHNGDHDFWLEGFNDFYVDKILTEGDFLSTTYDDHKFMRFWYERYAHIRGSEEDLNLLTDQVSGTELPYFKGAVFAYAMDDEIRKRSGNQYSLDDVLKFLWVQFQEEDIPGSYTEILKFLRTIIPGGIDDWWEYYLVQNNSLYLNLN